MKKAISPLIQIGTCTIASFGLVNNLVQAQVIPDNTLNTQVNVNENITKITGGETRGGNLFHSFQDFSISTGNEAFFDNANSIANIFSRVTGGNLSNIDGAIRANGSANLFLINPAGIIFGENARLDIGGSFYASSASSVLFEDGEFSAIDLDNPPVLTINAPVGLNLRDLPGDIVNRANNNLGLRVNSGETISLTGSEVSFDGGIATAPEGKVEVLGDKVSLINNASIDVSSETGGGTVLIGGDYQGQGSLNATRTYIDDTVIINANAITEGNGGRVIVWGDEVTGFYGNISVRGGDISGNGGFVEVSGKEHLIFRGNVDTTATNGFTGTLLLDPTNIIIANGSGDSATDGDNTFAGNNSNTPGSILSDPLNEIIDDAPTTIFESELEGLSGNTNIILEATNDITLQDLADDELTLAPGNGVIAFTADADADGVGDFVMEDNIVVTEEETIVFDDGFEDVISNIVDPADTIKTNGRSIAIYGANLTIGNIDTSFVPNDSGETIGTAQVVSSNSGVNVESISGVLFDVEDVDTYQIFLTGNGTFSASTVGGTTVDTQLFLFDAAGFGIYANDDQIAAVEQQSLLPANNSLTPVNPGIYYLSVTSNGNDPISDGGFIFPRATFEGDPNGFAIAEGINAPTGEGGNSPLIGFENDFFGEIGEYQVNLTGVEGTQANFVEAPQVMGDSGSITLNATNGNINVHGNLDSSIDFDTGGEIKLTATNNINLMAEDFPGIDTSAGDLTINAGEMVTITSNINTSNLEQGTAGDININAGSEINIIDNNIRANASTGSDSDQGDTSPDQGGNISIVSGSTTTLTDSNISTNSFRYSYGIYGNYDNLEIQSGNVTITGQSVVLNDTRVDSSSFDGEGGNVSIVSGSTTTLTNSYISTSSSGGFGFYGNYDDTNVRSGGITITGESVILNNTRVDSSSSDGEAGDVDVTATNGTVRLAGIEQNPEDNFFFTSDTISTQTISFSYYGDQNDSVGQTGGDITITGNSVVIDNYNLDARVGNQYSGGLGDGGNITITGESIEIRNNSEIATDTSGIGNAGRVLVKAMNSGSFEIISNSSITTSTEGQGNAGDITVTAGSISITEGANITADVGEQSTNLNVPTVDSELFIFNEAGESLVENDDSDPTSGGEGSFSGLNSFIEFTFEEDGTYIIGVGAFDSFVENGEIVGNRIASGQDYTLQVSLENQPVSGGDGLLTKIEPNDSLDNAQNINNSFSLNEDPNIQDSTSIPHVSISASGDGTFDYYSFNAEAGSLGIFDIDELNTDNTNITPGDVLAGSINLNATGDITISNDSEVSASTSGRGIGGSVNITTPNLLTIRDNSTVLVGSEGSATAGTLTINSGSLALENNGQISAITQLGKGGLLDINVENILSLRDSSRISAEATGQTGDAGDIDIDAGSVVAYPNLDEGEDGNDIVTSAVNGSAGDISITTEALLGFGLNTRRANPGNNTNDIDVFADSAELNGDFSLTILNVDLIESAAKLSSNVIEPETITAQTCSANREAVANSSLSINGKGNIAVPPDAPLDSGDIIINGKVDSAFIVPAPIETSKGKIQPARGVQITENGEVILTAYRTNGKGERILHHSINCH